MRMRDWLAMISLLIEILTVTIFFSPAENVLLISIFKGEKMRTS